jgi:hypothetical protein
VTVARVLLLAIMTAGCATRPQQLEPAPVRDWPVSRDSAQRAASTGHFDVADRTLAEFAREHASSAEGREALYWRALLRLDPANPSGPGGAVTAFDSYLASGGELPHRDEAVALRRLAARLDALGVGKERATSVGVRADRTDAAREEELNKLRQELKATQDELERIKRRLSAPKP